MINLIKDPRNNTTNLNDYFQRYKKCTFVSYCSPKIVAKRFVSALPKTVSPLASQLLGTIRKENMSYSTAVITRDVIEHILTPSAIGLPDGLFASTTYNLIHLARNSLDGFLKTLALTMLLLKGKH